MSQFPTRSGNGGKLIPLSDQQGFDRRWFAPYLQAVYAPDRPEQVANCVADSLTNFRSHNSNLVAIKRYWDP